MDKKDIVDKIKRIRVTLVCAAIIIIAYVLVLFVENNRYNKKSDSEAHIPLKFGATYMTMNNPYFQDMNAKIEEILEANGDILIYRDPLRDQEKQNEQILDMIEEGIDALFLNPVDWISVKPALEACREARVPVFNIDTRVYDDEYVAFSVLSDNYSAGVFCAEDLMKKKDSAKIVVLDSPGTNSIIERVQGFYDTIHGHDEYRIVVWQAADGELEVSMDVMNGILNEKVDFDVVLGGNDPTALGAVAALQMNKKLDNILIYGIDGSPDGKVMINEGIMEGSSAQRPLAMAVTAVEMAYDYLEGLPVETNVIVPVTLITKDNISEFDLTGWQ